MKVRRGAAAGGGNNRTGSGEGGGCVDRPQTTHHLSTQLTPPATYRITPPVLPGIVPFSGLCHIYEILMLTGGRIIRAPQVEVVLSGVIIMGWRWRSSGIYVREQNYMCSMF